MLKFITINDMKANKNWLLCHDIYIEDKKLNKGLLINESVVRYATGHLDIDNVGTYIIISDKPDVKESEIREFIIKCLDKFMNEEIRYINNRYYGIIVDEFSSRINLLVEKSFRELSMTYIIPLITNPIVLKKSLNLAILTFYFGVKLSVKFKELDELIYSSLLINLNMCNINSLRNISDKNFLIDYKESLIKSSYSLISEDTKISNNVKRLVRYANISQQSSADLYYKTDEKTGKKEKFLKDVTMEILQMSNDILTFDFSSNNIKDFYSEKKYTSVVQPAINMIISDINEKKNSLKNIKKTSLHDRIKNFFLRIFGTKDKELI